MADTHPYISGAGNVVQTINQLRSAFPSTVDAGTIKRLGIAPNNESYVINTLRFVGIIDGEHKKTTQASKVFSQHQDEKFAEGLAGLVKTAYKSLFDLHGDKAWTLDRAGLITFFRSHDETSATIGGRQASTFRALAALSGHGEVPSEKVVSRPRARKKAGSSSTPAPKATVTGKNSAAAGQSVTRAQKDLGLTVRIEINLPADGDQKTYDRIFKSIRENLLNG